MTPRPGRTSPRCPPSPRLRQQRSRTRPFPIRRPNLSPPRKEPATYPRLDPMVARRSHQASQARSRAGPECQSPPRPRLSQRSSRACGPCARPWTARPGRPAINRSSRRPRPLPRRPPCRHHNRNRFPLQHLRSRGRGKAVFHSSRTAEGDVGAPPAIRHPRSRTPPVSNAFGMSPRPPTDRRPTISNAEQSLLAVNGPISGSMSVIRTDQPIFEQRLSVTYVAPDSAPPQQLTAITAAEERAGISVRHPVQFPKTSIPL